MRGNAPTIRDVELNLEELVLPQNVLAANESLSSDDEGQEEEQMPPYNVDTCCGTCSTRIRVAVCATRTGIRTLEELLVSGHLGFVCPPCARNHCRHGR